ncbi:MAG: Protein of unknown function DUF650 [Candidatus Parvarchaeum acidophilus ARMAN-5]|jgi:hypothetical protein|uniref:DNA repair protein n=1 Tax=Candidatus Parvarchaeum acidophilus ARMAN-5 TaxID=662762 RepID=D6GWX4_PARA5|nr:MAG: Protein of unknown function DUF650 [Candidatus Parvarchaeum acidophilus ARMAN-5]
MKVTNVKSVYYEILKHKKEINGVINYVKKGDISGFTPPSALVGEYNYPNVSVGVMFTDDYKAQIYDAPKLWAKNNFNVSDVFSLRTKLVNASKNFNVNNINLEELERIRLAVISANEINIDLKVSNPNLPKIAGDGIYQHGIRTHLDKFTIRDNFKIDNKIEKIYYDKDMRATDGILSLYNSKIDENRISKMLSIGAMGIKRKLVPTKWSITAVDDSVGKDKINLVKTLPKGEDYKIITGQFLGNKFTFMFIKGPWSFELLETWNRDKDSVFMGSGDYEFYGGRKEYVKNTAGAYYAVRLAVLEKLLEMKTQYSVLVVREILPEYFVPLGVWVVREGARKAINGEFTEVHDMQTAISKLKSLVLFPANLENRSQILKMKRTQTTLI